MIPCFGAYFQVLSVKCAVQLLVRIADAKILILHLREVDVELIFIQQLHQQRLLLFHVADSDEIIYCVCRHLGIDIPIEK